MMFTSKGDQGFKGEIVNESVVDWVEPRGDTGVFSSGEFTSGSVVDWTLPTLEDIQSLQQDPVTIQENQAQPGLDQVGQTQEVEETTPQQTEQPQASQETISQEELELLREIRDSLKTTKDGSSESETQVVETITEQPTEGTTEASTESTTSYYIVMDSRLENLEKVMEVQARDQQLIGKIGIGCMLIMIGAFVLWLFIGRIR